MSVCSHGYCPEKIQDSLYGKTIPHSPAMTFFSSTVVITGVRDACPNCSRNPPNVYPPTIDSLDTST